MINNNVLCFRKGRKEHLLCFLPFHFSFAEIGWLAKASLIALETAVDKAFVEVFQSVSAI